MPLPLLRLSHRSPMLELNWKLRDFIYVYSIIITVYSAKKHPLHAFNAEICLNAVWGIFLKPLENIVSLHWS